jgi:hypothetical protein
MGAGRPPASRFELGDGRRGLAILIPGNELQFGQCFDREVTNSV